MHDHAYLFLPVPGRWGALFGPQAKKRDDCLRWNGASTAVVSLVISDSLTNSVPRTLFPRDGVEAVRNFLSAFFSAPVSSCSQEHARVRLKRQESLVFTVSSKVLYIL